MCAPPPKVRALRLIPEGAAYRIALKLRPAAAADKLIQFPTTGPPRADSFKRWVGAPVERRVGVTPLLFESGIQKVADQPVIPRRGPISLRPYLVPDLRRSVRE